MKLNRDFLDTENLTPIIRSMLPVDIKALSADKSKQIRTFAVMGASMATANRGVSALGASLIKLLDESDPGAKSIMLIANRDSISFPILLRGNWEEIRVVNWRQSPKARPMENIFIIAVLSLTYRLLPFEKLRKAICRICPWIRVVESASMVGDIRGGDSFSDIYGLSKFLLASIPPIAVLWIKGRIVLFPQTYGPFRHRIAKSFARYILRRADPILSRDKEGIESVRRLIGETARIRFCPDVAFALDSVKPAILSTTPQMPTGDSSVLVGVNANGLLFNGGYTRQNMFGLRMNYREFLETLVSRLLDEQSVRIIMVPHTFAGPGNVESDPDACRLLTELFSGPKRERLHLLDREYDQHEIKAIIGGCNFFVGSRLHSCIAALSQSIPTVGVAYSKKFKGVFESVGAGDWVVDATKVGAADATTSVISRFHNRTEMQTILSEKTTVARNLLRETFSTLVVETGSRTAST